MVVLIQAISVFLALLCCTVQADPKKADAKPRIKLEFRRAESKAADGLTEKTVEGSKTKVYLHKTADATNEDVAQASVATDDQERPTIEITFTKQGARKIAKLTEEHKGKLLAIVIDGRVISAPIIRDPFSERAVITGTFSKEEAEKLARSIKGP
jgi:preprotein translocase subunit SecD